MNLKIKNYSSISKIIYAYSNSIYNKKIKFIRPNNGYEWENTVLNCIFFCKIAQSIYYNFDDFRKQYHVKVESKLLYFDTTYSTEVDTKNYNFIFKTRYIYNYDGSDIIDRRVDIHSTSIKKLSALIDQMKYDLPSDKFNTILEHLIAIAEDT